MLMFSRVGLLSAQPDARLVELAQQGHDRAFEALVARYRRPLMRYCARLGLSPDRAEDVLQQALLRAWLALGRGAQVRDPRAWLFRIVRNTTLDSLNSQCANGERAAELTGHEEQTVPMLERIDDRITLEETFANMAALPELQRDALLLSAVDGRSYDEVARALGVSEGAVRGLLHRARCALRAAAGALTPQPALVWAAGRIRSGGSPAVRLVELCGPSTQLSSALPVLRGSAVAIGAVAALAGGRLVVAHDGHRASKATRPTTAEVRRDTGGAGVSSGIALVSATRKGPSGSSREAAGTTRAVDGGRVPVREGAGESSGTPVSRTTTPSRSRSSIPTVPAADAAPAPQASSAASSTGVAPVSGEGGTESPAPSSGAGEPSETQDGTGNETEVSDDREPEGSDDRAQERTGTTESESYDPPTDH